MVPGIDAVDTLTARFQTQLGSQLLSNAVDAAHGGHYPYLVAHANVAVLTNVSPKATVLIWYVKFLVYRLVSVFKSTAEVSLQVVLVYPVSCLHVLTGVAYGVAILNNVFTLFDVFDEHFVAGRGVLVDGYLQTIDLNEFTFFLFY